MTSSTKELGYASTWKVDVPLQNDGWDEKDNRTPTLRENEGDKLDYSPDPKWKPRIEEPWDWNYTLGPDGKWVNGTTLATSNGGWNRFLSKQALQRAQAHKKYVLFQRMHRVDKKAWQKAEEEGKFPEPTWAVQLRILAYRMPSFRPPQDSVEYMLFSGLSMPEAFKITCDELSKVPADLQSLTETCTGTRSAVMVCLSTFAYIS